MTETPAVSIVVPLYNKASFIESTLRSAIGQSFADFEIVIVDDGSTDDGAARALRLGDARLRLIRQDNAGVAAARNRAIAEARGALVAFLDADDVWAPDHLLHLTALAQRYPQAALYGNRFTVEAAGFNGAGNEAIRTELLDDYFLACATGRQPFFTSSCMASRAAAVAVGGFPEGYSRAEDLTLWIKLAERAPVAITSYLGCHYRKVAQSLTAEPLSQPDIAMRTLEMLFTAGDGVTATRRRSAREYYCRMAIAHALDCVRAGQAAAAVDFLRLAAGTIALRRRWWTARVLAAVPPGLARLGFHLRDRWRGTPAPDGVSSS